PERGWHDGQVTISERIEAARRERRILTRVSRAAWRLEQAERERTWALVSARAEGISIRTLAAAAGLPPSRVHQIVAAAALDALDAALGELRAGQPAARRSRLRGGHRTGRPGQHRRPPVGRGGVAATVRRLAQAALRGGLPAGGQPAPVRGLSRPGRRGRRPRAGGRGHRPYRRRRGRTRPGPAGRGLGYRRGAPRPALGTPAAAGR